MIREGAEEESDKEVIETGRVTTSEKRVNFEKRVNRIITKVFCQKVDRYLYSF